MAKLTTFSMPLKRPSDIQVTFVEGGDYNKGNNGNAYLWIQSAECQASAVEHSGEVSAILEASGKYKLSYNHTRVEEGHSTDLIIMRADSRSKEPITQEEIERELGRHQIKASLIAEKVTPDRAAQIANSLLPDSDEGILTSIKRSVESARTAR